MAKSIITLTVDTEIRELAKANIPNISKFLEDCLKDYLETDMKKDETKEDYEKRQKQIRANTEKDKIKMIEKLKNQEKELRELREFKKQKDEAEKNTIILGERKGAYK